ncbi:unnamed protein product [Ectocarpus fasciculatus]
MLHRQPREGLGQHRHGERLRYHRAPVGPPTVPRGVPGGGDRAVRRRHRRQRLRPSDLEGGDRGGHRAGPDVRQRRASPGCRRVD